MEKHYIFDLDGTLIDSASVIAKGVYDFFDERGVEYPPDIVKIIMPMGYFGFAQHAISLGVKGDPSEIAEAMANNFEIYYSTKIKLKPFAKEFIEKLVANGAHCHVLTGSPHRLADPCIRNNGIAHLLDNIWSIDDFLIQKSDPRLYYTIAERLGVSLSDICFLDDNCTVVKTCKELGLNVIAVYDVTSEEYKEEMMSVADKYIFSFDELL